MMTKRLRIPRGRPKKDRADVPFLQNPDRFWVMMIRATMASMPPPPSIYRAANVVAAHFFGNEPPFENLPPEGKAIMDRCPPGMVPRRTGRPAALARTIM
jgi:hypothetical protein